LLGKGQLSNEPEVIGRQARVRLHPSFYQLCNLDLTKAIECASKVFPQQDTARWASAFAAYLRLSPANRVVFEMFKPHFEFALENLQLLRKESSDDDDSIVPLGCHPLDYYMVGLLELTGPDKLLKRYYARTDPKQWARLFDHVGRLLANRSDLNPHIAVRIKDFFESRLANGDPEELEEFLFWLKARCLEPEYRACQR
jgi:hypothetical protein